MPSLDHYRALTDAELEKENQKLQAERSKIGEEQDRIARVRDERFAEEQAARVLTGMSPGDRDVLIEAAAAMAAAEAKASGGDS